MIYQLQTKIRQKTIKTKQNDTTNVLTISYNDEPAYLSTDTSTSIRSSITWLMFHLFLIFFLCLFAVSGYIRVLMAWGILKSWTEGRKERKQKKGE